MVTIKNRAGRRTRALLKAAAPVVLKERPRRGPGSAKSWIRGVVLGGLAVVLSACMPAGPRALLDGKKLLERGQYAQAVEKLEHATSVLTNNAVAWNYLGLAYHHAGRTTDAARAYQRALGLNHDLAEAHYNLGCLWLDQRKAESAKLELITYTLRRSDSAEGFTKLGAAQLQLREYSAAEKSFSDALRLGERNPEAWTGLGVARAQKGRVVEATQAFNTALKQQTNYAPALLNLAIFAQQSLRDRALALQKYREYLVLQPAADNAEVVRGIVRQLEQEIPPPARAPSPSGRPAAPPRSELATGAPAARPSATLARPYATGSNTLVVTKPEATPTAAKTPPPVTSSPAVSARPPTQVSSTTTKNPVAASPPPAAAPAPEVVTLKAEPVIKSAEDIALAPVNSGPVSAKPAQPIADDKSAPKKSFFQRLNPANLFGSEAKVEAKSGSPRADLPGVRRYSYGQQTKPVAGNRSEAERAFAQGVQAQQAHRLPEAVQAYRRAAQLDPTYYEAFYNLGKSATEAGSLQVALTGYESALVVRPDSVDARYNFALVLRQADYPVDAANELEKLLAAHPNEARAHLALGNLYAQQFRQPAQARQHYLRVLETDPRNPQANAIRYWLADNPSR